MTERRQFPVENADHLGFFGVKEQVAEPEIAMGDSDMAVIVRQMRGQPVGDRLQLGNALARRFPQLFGPARDLALEIVSGAAEIAETDLIGLHRMELRQCLGHAEIEATPLGGRETGQGGIMEDAALQPLHQIERRAERLGIGMEEHGARHRHIRLRQRLKHTELAVDRMGSAQDRPGRLLAQNQATRSPIDEIGRIGLAAADAFEREFAGAELRLQDISQSGRIKIDAGRHWGCHRVSPAPRRPRANARNHAPPA